jgi:hypothetical protein
MAAPDAIGRFVEQTLPAAGNGGPPTLVLGEIASIDEATYTVTVYLHGADTGDSITASFAAHCYVPRVGEDVWVWVKPGLTPIVWTIASERLFGDPNRGKIPAARLWLSTNNAVTNGVDDPVLFDTAVFDTDDMWSGGTSPRLTFNTGGTYAVGGCYGWPGAGTAAARRYTSLRLNGLIPASGGHLVRSDNAYPASSLEIITQNVSTIFKFERGDYIEMVVFQGGTGALASAGATTNLYPVMWAYRLTHQP